MRVRDERAKGSNPQPLSPSAPQPLSPSAPQQLSPSALRTDGLRVVRFSAVPRPASAPSSQPLSNSKPSEPSARSASAPSPEPLSTSKPSQPSALRPTSASAPSSEPLSTSNPSARSASASQTPRPAASSAPQPLRASSLLSPSAPQPTRASSLNFSAGSQAAQHSAAQHSAAQHSAAQHSAAQHRTPRVKGLQHQDSRSAKSHEEPDTPAEWLRASRSPSSNSSGSTPRIFSPPAVNPMKRLDSNGSNGSNASLASSASEKSTVVWSPWSPTTGSAPGNWSPQLSVASCTHFDPATSTNDPATSTNDGLSEDAVGWLHILGWGKDLLQEVERGFGDLLQGHQDIEDTSFKSGSCKSKASSQDLDEGGYAEEALTTASSTPCSYDSHSTTRSLQLRSEPALDGPRSGGSATALNHSEDCPRAWSTPEMDKSSAAASLASLKSSLKRSGSDGRWSGKKEQTHVTFAPFSGKPLKLISNRDYFEALKASSRENESELARQRRLIQGNQRREKAKEQAAQQNGKLYTLKKNISRGPKEHMPVSGQMSQLEGPMRMSRHLPECKCLHCQQHQATKSPMNADSSEEEEFPEIQARLSSHTF